VVSAIRPASSDVFIEVGPGRGALTRLLAEAAHVVAVEIDRDLVEELRAASPRTVTVRSGDFLDVTAARLKSAVAEPMREGARLRLAGNLPYNIASPILVKVTKLYASGLPIVDATFMLQREVAERLAAAAGSRDYGVLTVRIGYWAAVEPLLMLPAGAFRPAPKVQSTVLRLQFRPPNPAARDEATFDAVTRAIFTRRRKTLANALRALEAGGTARLLARRPIPEVLRALDFDPGRRPETFSIGDLVRLADAFSD
jgi:16S rRNA (adenine1518-N6/adenine1519-N6)-dimethyltransferase